MEKDNRAEIGTASYLICTVLVFIYLFICKRNDIIQIFYISKGNYLMPNT